MEEKYKTLYERLEENYSYGRIPMHMPGHKRNIWLGSDRSDGYLNGLSAELDITEIDGFDNLSMPEGILKRAEERAASLWGSDRAFFLVNGSTSGILAAVMLAKMHGAKILCARASHKSLYNALEITSACYSFIESTPDSETLSPGEITPKSVADALEREGDASFVFITSPTYEGVISDVKEIASVCHARGSVLVVDEAHGAHLGLYGGEDGAVKSGADIVIQSLHKTLPSLTQTAIAHLNINKNGSALTPADADDFETCVTMFQTSSPSYLLMASIDGCVDLLLKEGEELFDRWRERNLWFFEKANELSYLKVVSPYQGSVKRDFSKIIIKARDGALVGERIFTLLREEYNIELEMASAAYALAMTGMGDDYDSLLSLYSALLSLDKALEKESQWAYKESLACPGIPRRCLSVAETREKERVTVPLKEAEGYICAEYLWAYPPGVPIIIPGEEVDSATVEYIEGSLESGISIFSDKRKRINVPYELCVLKK